jgi:PD-(D/E)XK nuclease superfamily
MPPRVSEAGAIAIAAARAGAAQRVRTPERIAPVSESLRRVRGPLPAIAENPWLGQRAVRRETGKGGRLYIVDPVVAAARPGGSDTRGTGLGALEGVSDELEELEEQELRVPSVTTVNQVLNKPFLGPWQTRTALKSYSDMIKRDQRLLAGHCRLDGLRAGAALREWVKSAESSAARAADVVRDEAARLGTQAHDVLDAAVQDEAALTVAALADEAGQGITMEPRDPIASYPFEVKNVLKGFRMWRQDTAAEFDLLRGETLVYSQEHGYGGELDALARHKPSGKLVILDWKTSNAIHNEYSLQLAAYAVAVEEITGEEVDSAWVVRFGKFKPSYEARRVADLDTSFANFKAALQLYTNHVGKQAPEHWSAVRSATQVSPK